MNGPENIVWNEISYSDLHAYRHIKDPDERFKEFVKKELYTDSFEYNTCNQLAFQLLLESGLIREVSQEEYDNNPDMEDTFILNIED
jgi:hypothetical protein